ncbi:uncharacterized protein BDW70DRAFT_134846 [Aspergillus foveolatus]|uniref:uncharacterized protein n=1 Tax=Aspergillus foveolatus TaxID=210207 RepID=UPI003CCD84EF
MHSLPLEKLLIPSTNTHIVSAMPCYELENMCVQCQKHYMLLALEAPDITSGRHPLALYERTRDTYPAVFTAQFRVADPEETIRRLFSEVQRRASQLFKKTVHVYADIRIYSFRYPAQPPAVWASFLIDLPALVQVDQDLKDAIFGEVAPHAQAVGWSEDIPLGMEEEDSDLDPDEQDDLCLFRLQWFMKRLTHFPGNVRL